MRAIGKTALVTGASGGIGKGIAEAAARDGYALVLTSRNADDLEAFAADWRTRYGVEITCIAQDLSAQNGARALFEAVQSRGLQIDVLVNNAGIGVYGEFANNALEDELRMMRLNIEAPTVLAKLFLPQLLERRGRILNIASTASFPPGPFLAVYYASKAYLRSWSEGIAEELAPRGVSVTAYCPGPTHTGFQKAANAQRAGFFRMPGIPDGDAVGADAWRVCLRGQRLAVQGIGNQLQVFAMRFTPRWLLAKVVRKISQPV